MESKISKFLMLCAVVIGMGLSVTSCKDTAEDLYNELYNDADIFAFININQSWGLAVFEAMSCGLPVVAFDCPFGPGSIIKDNQCGNLIEDGNIPRFAEKLSSLMKNEDTRKAFSAAAIECAKDYSVESVMNCWKQLFESIVTTNNR